MSICPARSLLVSNKIDTLTRVLFTLSQGKFLQRLCVHCLSQVLLQSLLIYRNKNKIVKRLYVGSWIVLQF